MGLLARFSVRNEEQIPPGAPDRHGEDLSRTGSMVSTLPERFSAMPLHHRFALVGSLVSVFGMIAIGNFLSHSIETSVVRNSAISSAVYMESFIAPLSQELSAKRELSRDTISYLQGLLEEPKLAKRVVAAKLWREGGILAFATDEDLIGRQFPPDEDLKSAWAGDLKASFDNLNNEENQREQALGIPLLEVYNPIHSILTGEVIAVAELYLNATELQADLRMAHAKSWAIVTFVTLITFLALFGIVRAGSRTIIAQTNALADQLQDLTRVSAQNKALRERIQSASRAVSETHERYMRRISAELHDGPAQALAFVSLRLDAMMRRSTVPHYDDEVQNVRTTLDEALRDIRYLCRGLTLPQLEGHSIEDTFEMAITAHERRTGAAILREYTGMEFLSRPAPHPILICIYRFLQEGLMNAFRHAGDCDVTVRCHADVSMLTVTIEDGGRGFNLNCPRDGMGLSGLRERVESIGGDFDIQSTAGYGTRLTATLPLETLT